MPDTGLPAEAVEAAIAGFYDDASNGLHARMRAALQAAVPRIIAAERERCAKLADEHEATYWKSCGRRDCQDHGGNAPFGDLIRQGGTDG